MKFAVTVASPQGFSCRLELEGEKVYKDALKLLAQLEKDGFTPAPEGRQQGHQMPVQPSSAQSSTDGQQADTHYCLEHGVPFKARTGPHGEFWSHQIKGTRQWCNEAKR
jgi:hypothetical protein